MNILVNQMVIAEILQKARKGEGLSLDKTKFLFENLEDLTDALEIATELKSEQKENYAALYTCLYITNSCVNDCSYCGYRSSNEDLERITLSLDDIKKEAKAIKLQGISNVILIGGTIPEEKYKELIIKGTESLLKLGLNPWIEFENLYPETLENLSDIGANHFVLFQETYNAELFNKIHGNNLLKRDYQKRLSASHEPISRGFRYINIGSLLGLNPNLTEEIEGLYKHTKLLQANGAGVCISLPTLKPASGTSIQPNKVSDFDLEKAYIVLRLALPNISLALSGRESKKLRNRLFPIIDQIGTGGVTNPGGRTTYKELYEQGNSQFTLSDKRTPQEITQYLNNVGINVVPKLEWNESYGNLC